MKVGDSVIYQCDRRGNSYGTVSGFLADAAFGSMVKIKGKYGIAIVPRRDCKLFQAIDKDELDQAHAKMLPGLVSTVRDLFALILPTHTFEVSDGAICCGNISIDPGVVHRKSITCVREIPGWCVNVVTYYSGSSWEPPSSDSITVGEWDSSDKAAVEFVKTIVESATQRYLENKTNEAMAEDIATLTEPN